MGSQRGGLPTRRHRINEAIMGASLFNRARGNDVISKWRKEARVASGAVVMRQGGFAER